MSDNTNIKFDINKVKEDAVAEFRKEQENAAKKKILSKLKELDNARAITRNLERELEDLYVELTQ